MKENNNFDNPLKSQVENFYLYPNERVWQNIQQKMPKRSRMPNARNYSLVVILCIFGCFFNFLKHNQVDSAYNKPQINTQQAGTFQSKIISNNETNIPATKTNNNTATSYIEKPDEYIIDKNTLYTTTGNILNVTNHDNRKLLAFNDAPNNEKNNALNSISRFNNNIEGIIEEDDDVLFQHKTYTNDVLIINNNPIHLLSKLPESNIGINEVQKTEQKDVKLSKPNINSKHFSFKSKKEKRWERTMYIVPVMSSVKLSDNGAYGDLALLKQYNKLTSRFGIEVGTQLHYRIRKSTFAVGVQANVYGNKFTAYKNNEVERAYVVTTSANSYRLDSINTILRTVGTNDKSLSLSNKFATISFPVGFTQQLFKVTNNVTFLVAGNVAPSIVINADNYAVTGNVKNYIRASQFVRKWNINSSANFYLEYKLQNFRFQVGPQLRHQLLNTYIKGYPIKEKSRDIGIRIGINKSF
jgi:hypothetical protein